MAKVMQALLGLRPFVLVELKPDGDEDPGESYKVDLQFGGGVDLPDIRGILLDVLDALPEGSDDE